MSFADERMELARRIAKHQAPVHMKVSPQAARQELVRLCVEKLLEAAIENASRLQLTPADRRWLRAQGISTR